MNIAMFKFKSAFLKVIIHFEAYLCTYRSKSIILSTQVASINKR